MDYIIIDDSCTPLGGTSLTLNAAIEPFKDQVEFVSTQDLTTQHLEFKKPKLWILGNLTNLAADSYAALCRLMASEPFVKIEFDYGYCKFRGEIPHQRLGGSPCDCPSSDDAAASLFQTIYGLIAQKALQIFYMSEEQRNFQLSKVIGVENMKKTSVLSSCFLKRDLEKMALLRQKPKNGKYAIIDGQGGWHTEAKGIERALDLADSSSFDYELIKTKTHEEMLEKLSDFSWFIFLPLIHDTCPRVVIESKLMGLGVITSSKSQHVYEDWWHKKSPEESQKYLAGRPEWFHSQLKELHG